MACRQLNFLSKILEMVGQRQKVPNSFYCSKKKFEGAFGDDVTANR